LKKPFEIKNIIQAEYFVIRKSALVASSNAYTHPTFCDRKEVLKLTY